MLSLRMTGALVAAMIAVGCAHGLENAASGEVIDPADAAKTVVLRVNNQSQEPLELRTVVDGRSSFVGSVGPGDSTSILLDPTILPTGFLYVVGIPASGRGRAIVGPLAVSKGDKIKFNVNPVLSASRAFVSR